jgi:hypothetical protein
MTETKSDLSTEGKIMQGVRKLPHQTIRPYAVHIAFIDAESTFHNIYVSSHATEAQANVARTACDKMLKELRKRGVTLAEVERQGKPKKKGCAKGLI